MEPDPFQSFPPPRGVQKDKRYEMEHGEFQLGHFHCEDNEILEQKSREEWDFHPLKLIFSALENLF